MRASLHGMQITSLPSGVDQLAVESSCWGLQQRSHVVPWNIPSQLPSCLSFQRGIFTDLHARERALHVPVTAEVLCR